MTSNCDSISNGSYGSFCFEQLMLISLSFGCIYCRVVLKRHEISIEIDELFCCVKISIQVFTRYKDGLGLSKLTYLPMSKLKTFDEMMNLFSGQR